MKIWVIFAVGLAVLAVVVGGLELWRGVGPVVKWNKESSYQRTIAMGVDRYIQENKRLPDSIGVVVRAGCLPESAHFYKSPYHGERQVVSYRDSSYAFDPKATGDKHFITRIDTNPLEEDTGSVPVDQVIVESLRALERSPAD